MKGSNGKKAIFIQIGRKLATSKPYNKRASISFTYTNQLEPAVQNHVNQTQPVLPNRRKLSQPCSSTNNNYPVASNINDDFLFMRKENYLNTKFNIRKNKLKEITKENKQIHERINSQKSLYSSSDLNKSFESNCEIKKRLSQSKLSQRLNTSRNSSRSKNGSSKANRFEKKKEVKMAIKTTSIKDTEANDLQSFKALFKNQTYTSKNQSRRDQEEVSFKSYRQSNAYTASFKPTVRKSVENTRPKIPLNGFNEGGLLHRIAEQMIGDGRKIPEKRQPAYLKNKKMFNF